MEEAADAINYLSAFLAYEQIRIASDVDRFLDGLPPPEVSEGASTPTDVIVFCASAVLSIADTVFTALSDTTGPDGSSDPAKISL
ncbi:hypothetical protein GQ53DRAFT_652453 [Thozetella sp. PMI_491]|nr:hypothetical protein GQ53DRAFT_652453 [Thozetella sp. PMI_491]